MPLYSAMIDPMASRQVFERALHHFKAVAAEKFSTDDRTLSPLDFFGTEPLSSDDLPAGVDAVFIVDVHASEERLGNVDIDKLADYLAAYVNERTGARVRVMIRYSVLGYSFLQKPPQTLGRSAYEDHD